MDTCIKKSVEKKIIFPNLILIINKEGKAVYYRYRENLCIRAPIFPRQAEMVLTC